MKLKQIFSDHKIKTKVSMKLNWGSSIIFSFAVFAAGIIFLVAISMSTDAELVSENYYEQEIKYQSHIDLLKNSEEIKSKADIRQEGNEIVIYLEDQSKFENAEGRINFYRPSDRRRDFEVDLHIDDKGTQRVSAENLVKGLWKLKFTINIRENKYFFEKDIFIQ